MLGVKFILKRSSVNHPRCQIKVNPQFPDHSEDRTIGIGRLAHEGVGSFVTCDDDNVETEDLDVHDITCCKPSEGCITSGIVLGRRHAPSLRKKNHVPNTLAHSAKGIQADSNGQSKRLSMSGQPRGPGGSGSVDARRRRRIRNATLSNATTT